MTIPLGDRQTPPPKQPTAAKLFQWKSPNNSQGSRRWVRWTSSFLRSTNFTWVEGTRVPAVPVGCRAIDSTLFTSSSTPALISVLVLSPNFFFLCVTEVIACLLSVRMTRVLVLTETFDRKTRAGSSTWPLHYLLWKFVPKRGPFDYTKKYFESKNYNRGTQTNYIQFNKLSQGHQ